MDTDVTNRGGEDLDLHQVLREGSALRLEGRARLFGEVRRGLGERGENLYLRCISSPADREVQVLDPATGASRPMLMFGSNNYLGFANDPYVREQARRAIDRFGAGLGGPPLLNGHTTLHRALEGRLAGLKRAEDALLFPSGFAANVGLLGGLVRRGDAVLADAYSHASTADGIKLSGARPQHFPHNDLDRLASLLERYRGPRAHDVFVCVEGVYSMDGDLAPLDRLAPLCRARDAILLLDDAHGTGVLGPGGRGTAARFGVEQDVPLTMGTFSKAFAGTGGFIAGPKPVVDYLRFFARTYMFSASLPPVAIATVHAGLDLLEREPERLRGLHDNVAYAAARLRAAGFEVHPQAAIIPLLAPPGMDLRRAAKAFHRRGLFVNAVEYPAVPRHQQRFRVSVMATHTRADLDRLATAAAEVFAESRGELT